MQVVQLTANTPHSAAAAESCVEKSIVLVLIIDANWNKRPGNGKKTFGKWLNAETVDQKYG